MKQQTARTMNNVLYIPATRKQKKNNKRKSSVLKLEKTKFLGINIKT